MTVRFMNSAPIEEGLAILDLLCSRWGDCTVRELNTYHSHLGPYVEISYCYEHSDPDVYRFSVELKASVALHRLGYLKGTPHWGWTDDRLLQVSDRGRSFFWDEVERLGLSEELCVERWYW
jgi:hypothetical protein